MSRQKTRDVDFGILFAVWHQTTGSQLLGQFCPPGDIWQYLETFWFPEPGEWRQYQHVVCRIWGTAEHTSTKRSAHSRDLLFSSLSRVQLFVTPWTVSGQALLSMGFPKQEYWSGLIFPPPRDLPDPGTELTSPMSSALAGRFLITEPLRKLRSLK